MTVITGWTAVSPFGLGRDSFVDGLRSGRPTALATDPESLPLPDTHACLVPDLELAEVLDDKGTRHLDRATRLSLATLGELVEPGVDTGDRAGVVLGTTSGSVQTEMDHMRSSLLKGRPHHLDPKTLAGGTMNCAAAQCAIRYGITGPNTTIAGGRGAALHALSYACRLLAADRADSVIVGAVEEYTAARSWLTHHAGSRRQQWLGEGGAAFRLEQGDTTRRPLAEVVAVGSRVCWHDNGAASALTECVRGLLDSGGIEPRDVWAVLAAVGTGPEQVALTRLFDPETLTRLPGTEAIGDTGAASTAFALATALGMARYLPGAAGQPLLVLSSDPNGAVAGVLLRLAGDESGTEARS